MKFHIGSPHSLELHQWLSLRDTTTKKSWLQNVWTPPSTPSEETRIWLVMILKRPLGIGRNLEIYSRN